MTFGASVEGAHTRVKVCGVRDEETALVCALAGAHAVGIVFADASPRCVTLEEAERISAVIPSLVTRVGLFVDAPLDDIVRAHEACAFGLIQLHGTETVETCEAVRERTGVGVMRAVRFDEATIDEQIEAYRAVCDALLVDGSSGGKGEAFDWSLLAGRVADAGVPIVLAGGLTPGNVGDAVRIARPFGVDVSSGVESERGVKNHALIRSFLREVARRDWESSGTC